VQQRHFEELLHRILEVSKTPYIVVALV